MPGRITVRAFSSPTKSPEDSTFTHLSSDKAHRSHGSNCYSSYIGYHNDSQGAQLLEVQSICPCMIQKCWSRGSPITLQDIRGNGNGIGKWVLSSWRRGRGKEHSMVTQSGSSWAAWHHHFLAVNPGQVAVDPWQVAKPPASFLICKVGGLTKVTGDYNENSRKQSKQNT